MKNDSNIPKHEYYQKKIWISFAGCIFAWLISMIALLLPSISEKVVSIIAQICILVGFICMLFYIYYFVKRMKVPASEEHKRITQPWEKSND
jgi:hypothetical protein